MTKLIARKVGARVGEVVLGKFANQETHVELKECVRGQDIYVLQTAGGKSPNDNLMELLITLDALRRGSARRAGRKPKTMPMMATDTVMMMKVVMRGMRGTGQSEGRSPAARASSPEDPHDHLRAHLTTARGSDGSAPATAYPCMCCMHGVCANE